jgi:putative heme-binding domain-containing protein
MKRCSLVSPSGTFRSKLIGALGLVLMLLPSAGRAEAPAPLTQLTELIAVTPDTEVRLDILRGLSAALQGQRSVPMPAGWAAVEETLSTSDNTEVRALAQSLGLTFGSQKAMAALRGIAADAKAPAELRRSSIESLLRVHDASLAPLLQSQLNDPAVRGVSLRGLGGYDDAQTPSTILAVYESLNGNERRDALNTLASRVTYARPLLGAVAAGKIPKTDLTADLVRQLRNLKDEPLRAQLTEVWGVIRETSPDMQAEVEKYKGIYWAGGSQPGDAPRGRAVFNRICAQCHHLFDSGGNVGPNITGANRGDLDYLLQNILYPNAVIPNEYRAATLETKDGRVVTGIIKSQTASGYVVQTVNEQVTLPQTEVTKVEQSEISMMPEGLIASLQPQEIRDLLYYLGRPGQVPLPASP